MSEIVGYARVSSAGQSLVSEVDIKLIFLCFRSIKVDDPRSV